MTTDYIKQMLHASTVALYGNEAVRTGDVTFSKLEHNDVEHCVPFNGEAGVKVKKKRKDKLTDGRVTKVNKKSKKKVKSAGTNSILDLIASSMVALYGDFGSKSKSRSFVSKNSSPISRDLSPPTRSSSPVSKSCSPQSHSSQSRSRTPQSRSRTPQSRSRTPQSRRRTSQSRSRTPQSRSRTPQSRSRSPQATTASPIKSVLQSPSPGKTPQQVRSRRIVPMVGFGSPTDSHSSPTARFNVDSNSPIAQSGKKSKKAKSPVKSSRSRISFKLLGKVWSNPPAKPRRDRNIIFTQYGRFSERRHGTSLSALQPPSPGKPSNCKSFKNKNKSVRRSERKTSGELAREKALQIEIHLRRTNDRGMGLATRRIPGKGRGIVTTKDRMKGEFIVEYAGEIINLGLATERENEYSLDVKNGCYMYYFKYSDKQFCVDATRESGRLGRLINHSRKHPNLVTKVATLEGHPRLVLVANKNIAKGNELLFNYGDYDKESIKNYPWLAT